MECLKSSLCLKEHLFIVFNLTEKSKHQFVCRCGEMAKGNTSTESLFDKTCSSKQFRTDFSGLFYFHSNVQLNIYLCFAVNYTNVCKFYV